MGKVGVAVGVIVLALVVTIIVLSVGGKRKSPEKSESVVNPISEVRSKTEEDPIHEEDPVHEEDPASEDDPTYGQGHVTGTQLWEKYRLPSSLSPLYYNVTLWPRLTTFMGIYLFTGESGVAFTCVNETDLILIHSHKLLYTWTRDGHRARLSGLGGAKAPAIKKTWLEVETQYLVVQLSGKLQAGKTYWLYTEFRGELADDFVGLYRSEYVENGVKKIVATTRLEPTYARKAFPCFDEPAMKAVFHITLIHPLGTVALANSMEIGTERAVLSRQVVYRTRFAPTVKMSPYQLDFVVSDFVAIKTRAEAEVPIRIWGPRKAITAGQGDYALNITGRILGFFQEYYNVKYPLPKLDQIALPTFSVGTLEDSFKEKSLLFDPRMSSTKDKHWALIANSYELAQTWFGNLVTMKWWNDLWLNEGLSSYATYLVANNVQPTWKLKDLMVLYEFRSAFAVDALSSSHPLSSQEEEVNTPLDIVGMFDTVTYSKGAAVFQMLSDFLSEPVFAAGLSAYLKQFAYGNPEYADLWRKLQEVRFYCDRFHTESTAEHVYRGYLKSVAVTVIIY
ncbi:hypothetical protein NFI96_032912 [Prochilodus magdalenae]|nr:hypothetical protein NFI96_032912 [Prochilodus magdalenae]